MVISHRQAVSKRPYGIAILQYPKFRRAQISFPSRRKSEMTQNVPFRHFPRDTDTGTSPDLDTTPFEHTETF